VKFIINTSFDPQFCALSIDNQWQTCFFSSKKKAGQETWEFLRDKNLEKLKLSFIGGVTGPGGFSSLRAASGILESLSLFYKLPIHQISTGEITQELLSLGPIKSREAVHRKLIKKAQSIFDLEYKRWA
jgi:tRNA A37 threonylcarbamoyladenosine modification protein TsaB